MALNFMATIGSAPPPHHARSRSTINWQSFINVSLETRARRAYQQAALINAPNRQMLLLRLLPFAREKMYVLHSHLEFGEMENAKVLRWRTSKKNRFVD